MLFLVHDPSAMSSSSLPKMAGLEVAAEVRAEDGKGILSVRLENDDDADIFARFCDDIVMTISAAGNEVTAVQAFIGRTWKWHALLKGARKKTLSREAQLGLIGELRTMSHGIAPVKGLGTALEAWRGPEGNPKDFELAGLCIECKARGASSRAKVRITSEHQLADVPGHQVVLIVHTFASANKDDTGALDLHGAVAALRSAVLSKRPDLRHTLVEKLEKAGYEDEHEYEVFALHRATDAFRVGEGFPRIVPGDYPEGPVEISYDLPLAKITPFEIDADEMLALIQSAEGTDE
jgi:putative PD-(D/E)XK family protein DUF4420